MQLRRACWATARTLEAGNLEPPLTWSDGASEPSQVNEHRNLEQSGAGLLAAAIGFSPARHPLSLLVSLPHGVLSSVPYLLAVTAHPIPLPEYFVTKKLSLLNVLTVMWLKFRKKKRHTKVLIGKMIRCVYFVLD